MADGYHVDLGALGQAAAGVSDTLSEATQRQVSDIPHDQSAIGHAGLAGTLSDFLGRWQRGVNNLVTDGREIATRLTTCADNYRAVELHNHGQITLVNGELTGTDPDPGAS
jgi:hypothetical protein